jgi:hypothetical protein
MQYSVAPSAAAPVSRIDNALADLSKTPEQLRAELPAEPEKQGGVARNVAAGGNDMAASILGGPVDAMTWAVNKAHDILTTPTATQNAASSQDAEAGVGASIPTASPPAKPWITNPFGGSESIKSGMGLIGADPRNVGVNDTGDMLARAAGGGAVGMAAPYMAGRALIAGGVGAAAPTAEGAISSAPPTMTGTVAQMVGGSGAPDAGILKTGLGAASNAAVGGAAALGGQGAEALLPPDSPYRPLANMGGQMFGGGALAALTGAARAGVNYGVNQVQDMMRPMSQAGREAIVGQRLRDAASDLPAAQTALDAQPSQLVPGSLPTTFQLAGDQGLGQLERAQRTANPAPFLERAGDQNAARVGALGDLSPENANPGSVRDLLQQHMQTIDATGDAAVQGAQQAAQQQFDAAGGRMTPQGYGSAMRDQLEAAKAATKQQESVLWKAIDPDGTLAINGTPVKAAAEQIATEKPNTAAPMSGDEAGIFQATKFLGTGSPFSQFSALRSRLLDGIRTEAAANGQSQAWRRMQMLRGAMDATMENTADGVAQQQEQAVASGTMTPEQTMLAKLAQNAQAHYLSSDARIPSAIKQLAAGGGPGVYSGASPSGGSPGIAGGLGEGGAPGRGFGSAPVNTGLQSEPQPVATFDADAAARYRAAADATKARAQTFNNPVVGPVLQERGGMYRLGDSQLHQFARGSAGFYQCRRRSGDAEGRACRRPSRHRHQRGWHAPSDSLCILATAAQRCSASIPGTAANARQRGCRATSRGYRLRDGTPAKSRIPERRRAALPQCRAGPSRPIGLGEQEPHRRHERTVATGRLRAGSESRVAARRRRLHLAAVHRQYRSWDQWC